MSDTSTRYLGLRLSSPIIAASSGITSTVEGIVACAEAGAGAVVLKSIFEEQIQAEVDAMVSGSGDPLYWHTEAADYIREYGWEKATDRFVELLEQAKKAVDIPVIPSIHCVSPGSWTSFVSKLQDAGADAIELNAFILPSDPRRDARANEGLIFEILAEVKEKASIPVALKLGSQFSALAHTMKELDQAGADGLVLFNRFNHFDFDLDTLKLVPAFKLSHCSEIALPLRWISILSTRLDCSLAASGGVHDGAAVCKLILAGADAVQVASILYEKGANQIRVMLDELEAWMAAKGFASLDDFRGKLARGQSEDPAAYYRVQFMKHVAGHS